MSITLERATIINLLSQPRVELSCFMGVKPAYVLPEYGRDQSLPDGLTLVEGCYLPASHLGEACQQDDTAHNYTHKAFSQYKFRGEASYYNLI